MGKRQSYEPGTFSWVDLSTPDAEGAKAFYGGLFGWDFRDDEIPGGGVYTMCLREGDEVGAIVEQGAQPAHWHNYVSVASAAARVNALGCMGWNELQTRDSEAAGDFYRAVFGWETEPIEQDGTLVYT